MRSLKIKYSLHISALLSIALLSFGAVFGCDEHGDHDHSAHENDDHSDHMMGGTSAQSCEDLDGGCFSIGWSQMGERFTLTVEEAAPEEPQRGLNNWTMALTDSEGMPATECALLLIPFMPDHNHGSVEVEGVERGGGRYFIEGLDLIMPGMWELRFEVTCGDEIDALDSIMFMLWLEG
jgi:hypothetical protein